MAKIPQYQQQQLVSSIVGTPGVDTSGEALANKIGNQAQSISNTLFTDAVRKQRQLDAESRALAAAKQKQLDTIETNKHLLELDIAWGANFKEIENNSKDAPGTIVGQAQKVGQELLDERLKNIPSESVRNAVTASGTNLLRNKLNGAQSSAETLATKKGIADFNSQLDLKAVQAGNAADKQEFDKLYKEFDEFGGQAAFVYGAAGADKIKAARNEALDQRIDALLIDKKYDEARAVITDPQYKEVLDAKDRFQKTKEIQSLIDSQERAALVKAQKLDIATRNENMLTIIKQSADPSVPLPQQMATARQAEQDAINRGDAASAKVFRSERERLQTKIDKPLKELSAQQKTEMFKLAEEKFNDVVHRMNNAKPKDDPNELEVWQAMQKYEEALKTGAVSDVLFRDRADRMAEILKDIRTGLEEEGKVGKSYVRYEVHHRDEIQKNASTTSKPDEFTKMFIQAEAEYRRLKHIPTSQQLTPGQKNGLTRLVKSRMEGQ